MLKITLILFISAFCFAADQLPASTASAVKAYDAEVAKAKAEYDKREDAAKKILVSALRKVQDAETKAGNLEGALAIKKRIDELTPKISELLGDDNKMIIGKWKKVDNNEIIVINQNGTGKRGLDDIIWTFDKDTNFYNISYPAHSNWGDSIELKNSDEAVISFKSGGSIKLMRVK